MGHYVCTCSHRILAACIARALLYDAELKEAERLRRRHIELQINLKIRENERKRRHCTTTEVNGGFLTRSAEQLRNKEAAKKVFFSGFVFAVR